MILSCGRLRDLDHGGLDFEQQGLRDSDYGVQVTRTTGVGILSEMGVRDSDHESRDFDLLGLRDGDNSCRVTEPRALLFLATRGYKT